MIPIVLQNLMLALVAVADAFMLGEWIRIIFPLACSGDLCMYLY